jgi:glycerophosphoryl diester phosphodiesterase
MSSKLEELISYLAPSPRWLAIYCILYAVYRIFYEFPHLLHDPKKSKGIADRDRQKPASARLCSKIIAHRGSRAEGLPENSLAAFQDAIDSDIADIIELDVWLSKDGHVVVHHDENFTRMTSGKNNNIIHETDYADFPEMDPPQTQCERLNDFQSDIKDIKDNKIVSSKTGADFYKKIPLFEDVVKMIPLSICMIVEFKQNSDELVRKVHDIIISISALKAGETGKTTRKDNLLWFSLQDPINVKLRACDPTIPIIASVPNLLKTLMLHYCCLLPFFSVDFDAMGIPVDEVDLARVRNEKSLKKLPDWVKRIIAYVFAGKPSGMMVSPSLFRHLRKRGIPTWFLGVNDSTDVRVAVEAGASGVLTDRINWMKSYLREGDIKYKGLDPY